MIRDMLRRLPIVPASSLAGTLMRTPNYAATSTLASPMTATVLSHSRLFRAA